jgi:HTH-type transcriptional regulator, sugar sensing transcriptional regulator
MKTLMEAGLTEKESLVYLELLKLGTSTASQIIEKTGLHRAVVYDLLGRLIEKGLASHITKGKKKYFEASNPKRLIEILKEKENKIEKLIPNLSELYKYTDKLDVKIYKGKEGIKAVYEDMLAEKPSEWLAMGSGGETAKLMPAYFAELHKKRIKLGIKGRGLFITTSTAKARGSELSKRALTEIRYLPKDFVTPTVINIYNDIVILYSASSEKIPSIIKIENSYLAKSFREYFEWLWKVSK